MKATTTTTLLSALFLLTSSVAALPAAAVAPAGPAVPATEAEIESMRAGGMSEQALAALFPHSSPSLLPRHQRTHTHTHSLSHLRFHRTPSSNSADDFFSLGGRSSSSKGDIPPGSLPAPASPPATPLKKQQLRRRDEAAVREGTAQERAHKSAIFRVVEAVLDGGLGVQALTAGAGNV